MNTSLFYSYLAVTVALLAVAAPSSAGNHLEDNNPKVIASAPGFAIHQFKGFVKHRMVESVIRSGIVISHTNLKTGEMKWIVSTGVHSIPTRRISYSVTRLVGLIQDDKHLIIVVYSSGRSPREINRLLVLTQRKGNMSYRCSRRQKETISIPRPSHTLVHSQNLYRKRLLKRG